MKVHWHKSLINGLLIMISISILMGVFDVTPANGGIKLLTRKETLLIAESTEEVELLYQLNDGRLKNCIEKEVIKPCESDWVTCVENAWVVQFTVGTVCQIHHDGRLGITLLIDAITGKVISRFPEAEYFAEAKYCLEDIDCIWVKEQCQNFIHGQLDTHTKPEQGACQCQNNMCAAGN